MNRGLTSEGFMGDSLHNALNRGDQGCYHKRSYMFGNYDKEHFNGFPKNEFVGILIQPRR